MTITLLFLKPLDMMCERGGTGIPCPDIAIGPPMGFGTRCNPLSDLPSHIIKAGDPQGLQKA